MCRNVVQWEMTKGNPAVPHMHSFPRSEFLNTQQNGGKKKMVYMLVRHSVEDYKAWKSVFDSVGDLRRRSGEKSYQILRQGNGSNELVALFEWDSLDNARKYAASPELKAAMERAGVTGKPEILFLEEAARG
jgi:heme-degrading monooxygenase HmoA